MEKHREEDEGAVFYFFDASRAALMRGARVRRGSAFLKKGCCGTKNDGRASSARDSNDQRRDSNERKKGKETNLQQLNRIRSLLGVDLQSPSEVVPELPREVLGLVDLGCSGGSDEVESSERVLVEVGRFSFDHFCEEERKRRREVSKRREGESERGREGGQEEAEDEPMAMIPSDQISTLGPYSFLVTTSGAIQ